MLGAPEIRSAAAARRPRLVLLYAPCTVNKNFLHPCNPSVGYTPHLKHFAAGAVKFRDMQAECGMSGACYASIFTGCYGDRHEIFEQPGALRDVLQITGTFSDGGYETFFWDGHPMASRRLNYGSGVKAGNSVENPLLADHPLFLSILKKLASDPEYKAFIVTNFTVTHAIYMPPDLETLAAASGSGTVADRLLESCGKDFWNLKVLPEEFEAARLTKAEFEKFNLLYQKQQWMDIAYNFDGAMKRLDLAGDKKDKFIRTLNYLYKLNVARLDLLFGMVVKRIEDSGLMDESAVAFTADHGETLYRDNTFFKYSHTYQLAPEVLSVPFLLKAPGTGGGDFQATSRSVDIFPTLAALCGLKIEAGYRLDGTDLSPYIGGGKPPPRLLSYSHTELISKMAEFGLRAVRADAAMRLFRVSNPDSIWLAVKDGKTVVKLEKRVLNGALELAAFDLESDPEERKNFFNPSDPAHAALRDELFAYKIRIVKAMEKTIRNPGPGVRRDEQLKKLKELGYVR